MRPFGPAPVLAVAVLLVLAGWIARPAPDAPSVAAGAAGADVPVRVDTIPATVVLLHGLGRTSRSMEPMRDALAAAGYRVVNLGYPSRDHTTAELAAALTDALDRCCRDGAAPVHVVTHSLGGILLRRALAERPLPRLGRVVMLSPPNRGSEVVDRLPDELLELLLGPAALELGTDSGSVHGTLPPPSFELGIITGDASLNPLFSLWLPGEDDGKVAVESARMHGVDDFLVVPYTHTFIMRRQAVVEQVLTFLETGEFRTDADDV